MGLRSRLATCIAFVLPLWAGACGNRTGHPATDPEDTVAATQAPAAPRSLVWAGCATTTRAIAPALTAGWTPPGAAAGTSPDPAVRFAPCLESDALQQVQDGRADLAATSLFPSWHDHRRGLRFLPVAWSALAIAVHPDNPVADLTQDQLRGLLNGTIRNWREVGGRDARVDYLGLRHTEAGSGRLLRLLLGEEVPHYPATQRFDCPLHAEQAVHKEPGAFVVTEALTARAQGLRVVTLDGVAPTRDAMGSGRYPLVRPFYVVFRIHADDATRDLVEHMRGPGQQGLPALGALTIAEGEALWAVHHRQLGAVELPHATPSSPR